MDHDRAVLFVIRAFVGQVETLRQVVVHLDRTELPLAADGVLDHKIKFRAIKGSFAQFDHRRKPFFRRRLDDRGLGLVPVFVRTDVLLLVVRVAQRNLRGELVEAQRLEDIEHDIDHLHEFILELVGTAEDVRIVLREAPHARQPVQLAALLVTIHRAEFCETQRQVLVRARLPTVNLAVVRTVHRLEQELLAVVRRMDRLERILAVLGIVARSDV